MELRSPKGSPKDAPKLRKLCLAPNIYPHAVLAFALVVVLVSLAIIIPYRQGPSPLAKRGAFPPSSHGACL